MLRLITKQKLQKNGKFVKCSLDLASMYNIEHTIIYYLLHLPNCSPNIYTDKCMLATYFINIFVFVFVDSGFSHSLLVITCFFFLMQDSRSLFYNHENVPIGTKVQAVWSEDGEWYVENIEMSAFLSISVFSFSYVLPFVSGVSFVNYSGMKQRLRRILRMAIMFVMMDGGIKKRYYICSHSFESLTPCLSMHPLPLSSYCILSLQILFIFLKLTFSKVSLGFTFIFPIFYLE